MSRKPWRASSAIPSCRCASASASARRNSRRHRPADRRGGSGLGADRSDRQCQKQRTAGRRRRAGTVPPDQYRRAQRPRLTHRRPAKHRRPADPGGGFTCVLGQGRLGCRAQRFTLLKNQPPALPSMHLNGAQGRGISALCVPLPDMAQAGLRTTAKQRFASKKAPTAVAETASACSIFSAFGTSDAPDTALAGRHSAVGRAGSSHERIPLRPPSPKPPRCR